MLVVALLAISLDPDVSPLVLTLAAGLGIGLAVMGTAMGLGLLGFGLFAAGDWVVGWLRRALHWPDE